MIFVGADFSSLEDRISALTTKDPNKLKVYTDGFDGHCLRAYGYFGDKMVGISDTLDSINSISKMYPELRQSSKNPTFLLTYGGTHYGIQNLGFTKEQALSIESKYHILYAHSDAWVHSRLVEASNIGYVVCAFGLRVRTHILERVMFEEKESLPYEARAEGRTAGNALGQSWGLLNNRAAIDFMERVYASKYKYVINPSSLIHDAFYLLIEDSVGCVKFTNDNLTHAMSWQELDEISHDTVKLSAELDLFYRSWATPITLKNNISLKKIKQTVNEYINKDK